MDYNELNVFEKEKFQLHSDVRNRDFRYIRYIGQDYNQFVAYIQELSKNTEVWPIEWLKKGTLYTFSGRDFKMGYVDEIGLRATVVNNPYLITSDGKQHLALTKEQAEEYLRQSPSHTVFCPENALATYKINKEGDNIFYEYSDKHPKGIDRSNALPDTYYYICNRTLKPKLSSCYSSEYINGELFIKLRLDRIVEEMEKKKYLINDYYIRERSKCIFNPSWKNWKNRNDLYQRCLNKFNACNIIRILWSELFDETKNKNENMLKTINAREHEFVKTVEALNTYYNYNGSKSKMIEDLFLRYFNCVDDPRCASDYENLQIGLYNDFLSFLSELLDRCKVKKARIELDDNGILHCSDTQLSNVFSEYRGCVCLLNFKSQKKNKENNRYKYFCDSLDYVEIKPYEGIVEADADSIFYTGEYRFHKYHKVDEDSRVIVKRIRPIISNNKRPYRAMIEDYIICESVEYVQYEGSDFLKNIVIGDQKKKMVFLDFLHKQYEDSKPSDFACIIRASEMNDILNHPSYPDIKKEFGDKCSQQIYSKYTKPYEDNNPKVPNVAYKRKLSLIKRWLIENDCENNI